ncbi:hypothetical protein [Caenispirillum bisanense]|uniref:hypothetical protein n=1 Tax=Caenispirillum bisanense TaxID=414052 RepID=UPI0031D5833B
MSTELIASQAATEIVQFLDGQRFSPSELCHAGDLKTMSLPNLLNKSNLELASANPGRGRAREFCLVDVYALVLMDRVVKLLKDYGTAANIVNSFTFSVARILMMEGKLPYGTDHELKQAICDSLRLATPEYFQRDLTRPWYIVIRPGEEPLSTKDPLEHIPYAMNGMIIFNVTLLFAEVDKKLARMRGFDFRQQSARLNRKMAAETAAAILRPPAYDDGDLDGDA